jgi:predicted HTH transcriptional regulator
MIENARNSGFMELIFSESDGGILVSFKKNNYPPKDTPKDTPNITQGEEKMLLLIRKNSKITREELATELGISVNTVKPFIRNLKNKGILIRIGNNRNGYWEIL